MADTLRDLSAERAVLGAILVDADAYDVAAGLLHESHFSLPEHGFVWQAMARLRAAGMAIDPQTLRAELERAKRLDSVGGMLYLSELVTGVTRASNVDAYARIVVEKATLRGLVRAAERIVADAQDSGEDAAVLCERAEARIAELTGTVVRGDFVHAEDWMLEVSRDIEKATIEKKQVTGVPTGFPTLDRMTRGLQPADLIYIGARPSTGKTSLALQLAIEASKHTMTAFVSVEMSRRAVGVRAVSMEARVDAGRIFTGFINSEEQRRIGDALARLSSRRLAIDDAAGQTATGVRAKVRRLARKHGCGAVFIDYMQLLHDQAKSENRNQELAAISAGLKALAKELDAPVVVLSQLSRDSAKSPAGGRPQLHHLRDSGSLEQDADLVMLLHRPNQHADGQRYEDGELAEIIIAKQRNGATGPVPLQWQASTMRFTEVSSAFAERTA